MTIANPSTKQAAAALRSRFAGFGWTSRAVTVRVLRGGGLLVTVRREGVPGELVEALAQTEAIADITNPEEVAAGGDPVYRRLRPVTVVGFDGRYVHRVTPRVAPDPDGLAW
jgi:hypothetical protein